LSLQATPAATTEDVSFIAVPAHIPKPKSLNPKSCPKGGNKNTAIILNRKIVEIDWATFSSLALITGAVAAIAEPPQMDVPTPIKIEVILSIFRSRLIKNAVIKAPDRVKSITNND